MRTKLAAFLLAALAMLFPTGASAQETTQPYILDVPYLNVRGTTETLELYQGNVIMVVNTASKCGLTPQYEALEKLYQEKKDQGLVIIAFPANDFGNQEPGTNEEIQEFCKINYGVTFPVQAKLSVKDPEKAPIYKRLTGPTSPFPGEISWNFEKFLVDRKGNVIARFAPRTRPDDPAVVEALEKALAAGQGQ